MNPQILNIIGLCFDIIGASLITGVVIMSKKQAVNLGVSRLSGSDEQNLKLPAVKDKIRQSQFAVVGLFLLIIGFGLQILANAFLL